MMSRLERLKERETELRCQMRDAVVRGGNLPKLQRQLDATLREIREEEDYAVKSLSQQLPREVLKREHIPELIGEIHMLMDCVVDATFELRTKLDKFKLDDRTITPKVRKVENLLSEFVGAACKMNPFMEWFICDNEELVAEVRKLTKAYVNSRIGSKDGE